MALPIMSATLGTAAPTWSRLPTIQSPDGPSFADVFRQSLNEASGLQDEAKRVITAFVQGQPVEIHEVMAATEEAAISLELLVEIRNKLTEAYRTVMNMQ